MHENTSRAIDNCYLEVLDDVGRVVKVVRVSKIATIGRAVGNHIPDIVVPAECQSVSKSHAILRFSEGRAVLTDFSRYGTIVNDEVVLGESVTLEDHDLVIFGRRNDGWQVRIRIAKPIGRALDALDALEELYVSTVPPKVMIFDYRVEERLGDKAFRLLEIFAANKGQWFTLDQLAEMIWPIPDDVPLKPNIMLAKCKNAINDVLRPYMGGQDVIEARPFQGYRVKIRLWPSEGSRSGPPRRGVPCMPAALGKNCPE